MPKGYRGFQKGHQLSKGRPKGSKNKATLAKQKAKNLMKDPALVDAFIKFCESKSDNPLDCVPKQESTSSRKYKSESVYFLRVSGTNQVKIGLSKSDYRKRVNSIQTSSPNNIELICAISVKDASFIEKALHEKYKHCHIRGEWFDMSNDEVFKAVQYGSMLDFNCNVHQMTIFD